MAAQGGSHVARSVAVGQLDITGEDDLNCAYLPLIRPPRYEQFAAKVPSTRSP